MRRLRLFGAAASWWEKAVGKYAEGAAPRIGSVLVFKAMHSLRSGHVATVTQVVGDRIIKVTHANWGGAKGRVEHDVTIVDASAANDWSAVKVWYAPIKDLGLKAYPVYGFIYGDAAKAAVGAEAPPAAKPVVLAAPVIAAARPLAIALPAIVASAAPATPATPAS